MWYHRVIGKERCPIVDTWWQTETGGIMIAPLPGATPTKPGSATLPLPGIVPEVAHRDGQALPAEPGRLPRHDAALARHAAHHLRRPRALHAAVLEPDPRHLLHRRRRAPRRGRLLLGHGPRRRRDERRRPPARHDGGRERPGQPSDGGRGRRRRPARRAQGPGDRRFVTPRSGHSARRTSSRRR